MAAGRMARRRRATSCTRRPAADSRRARRAGRHHPRPRLPAPSRAQRARRFAATTRRWRDARARAPITSSSRRTTRPARSTRDLAVAATRVTVCSPGVPGVGRRRSRSARAGRATRRRILFIGTLEPRKNVGGLLDAYAHLRARRARRAAAACWPGASATPAAAELDAQRTGAAGRVTSTSLGYVATRERQRALSRRARCWCCRRTRKASACRCSRRWPAACRSSSPIAARCPEVAGDAATPVDPGRRRRLGRGDERAARRRRGARRGRARPRAGRAVQLGGVRRGGARRLSRSDRGIARGVGR